MLDEETGYKKGAYCPVQTGTSRWRSTPGGGKGGGFSGPIPSRRTRDAEDQDAVCQSFIHIAGGQEAARCPLDRRTTDRHFAELKAGWEGKAYALDKIMSLAMVAPTQPCWLGGKTCNGGFLSLQATTWVRNSSVLVAGDCQLAASRLALNSLCAVSWVLDSLHVKSHTLDESRSEHGSRAVHVLLKTTHFEWAEIAQRSCGGEA